MLYAILYFTLQCVIKITFFITKLLKDNYTSVTNTCVIDRLFLHPQCPKTLDLFLLHVKVARLLYSRVDDSIQNFDDIRFDIRFE